MPGAPTPNLGLTVPTVGSDFNIWGNELNSDLAILDGLGAPPFFSFSTSGPLPLSPYPQTFFYLTGGPLGITVQLPAPATVPGKLVTLKRADSDVGVVFITTAAGNIDGGANWGLYNQYQYVTMQSANGVWNVVANN